ncbi:hypothetical protein ACFR9U_01820 [Halorientalis brevis]|uniref:Uncharacterized protein n=1 Tax=Halorientalis brevis TaxID=1126241 RepID=A0ABD6C679_9EURY|nr:hypothetical protein [Halorientalis brevis]
MSSDSDSDEYPRAPAQKARDENILGVFEATDDPVLTTSEVAEELPIGKRATLNRLEDLVDREEIDSKDVGVGRVWWRATPAEPEEPESEAAEVDVPADEPAEVSPPPGAPVTEPMSRPPQASEIEESPKWAFIGSLGRHSIFAGIFLLGLLITETSTPTQQLLPVSVGRLFLTAFVFFLIGFPSYVTYRTKQYVESTDLSLSQFLGPISSGGEDSGT